MLHISLYARLAHERWHPVCTAANRPTRSCWHDHRRAFRAWNLPHANAHLQQGVVLDLERVEQRHQPARVGAEPQLPRGVERRVAGHHQVGGAVQQLGRGRG